MQKEGKRSKTMRHEKGMRIAACLVRSSLCLVFADSLCFLCTKPTIFLDHSIGRAFLLSLSPSLFSIFFFFFLCPPGGLTTVVPVGIYHSDHRLSAMFSSLLCYKTVFSKFFFFFFFLTPFLQVFFKYFFHQFAFHFFSLEFEA